MKNKLVLVIVLLFVFNAVFAQKNTVHLVSSNDTETVLSFKLNSFDFKDVNTPNGIEKIIISDNLSPILQKGTPDLPKFTESIIIPDVGNTKIEIISSEYYEIENVNIAPSKGNFTRDIDPATVPYEYSKIYTKDEFFPNQIAGSDIPYIVRDFRGQAIHVYPFTYNPVKNILRVYTEVSLKVVSVDGTGENEYNRSKAVNKIAREFNQIYSNHFLNYDLTKYTPVEEEGNMLIICYDDWTAYVQPLVDWKNTIGRPCEMITVTEAGSSASAIKTYVTDYYNTNGLSYLLLIGDATQIPTNSGGGLGGDSDNAYGYITGNDHYQEFFVGRFSAESITHVETQVLRTLEYEAGDQLSDGWLNMIMSVGSNQGPGDDNEYDYEHLRNMQTDLLAFTYVEPIYEHFDGSQGGFDQGGNPSASEVGVSLNSGLGIANYTGHGSTTSWSTSGFSVSNVNSLTNDNKLPFIWSVACVNGNFVGTTCFAEAWMRAENGGEPTGAIATFMSTINQSWDPPMAAQDEMVDLLAGTSSNGIKRTFGGLSVNGCFLMNDEYADFAMTDTWTIFGDPSLYVRTDNPSDMTITHDDVVIVGTSNFDVSCDLDGALATLSFEGQIIGSSVVSGGSANIPVSGVTPGESLTLAVVGFNKVTYLTNLNVISPDGPYLVIDSYVNETDFGQSVNLDIVLENVGQDEAIGVSVVATTSDPNASISNGTYSYGNIAAGTTSSPSSGAFTLTVDNDLEDQYLVAIDFAITDGNKTLWEQSKNVTVNAPVFDLSLNEIDDGSGNLTFMSSPVTVVGLNDVYSYDISVEAGTGNANGLLDAGETAIVSLNASNNGHAASLSSTVSLTASNPEYVTVNNNEVTVGVIEVGETLPANFSVSIDESTPVGTVVELIFTLESGAYTEVVSINLAVGLQVEDFESGDFSSYAWTMGGSADWLIDTDAHNGTYSAKSGDVSDNQDSEISVTIDVAGDGEVSFWSKVSSEGSWDYLKFYIDGSQQGEWSGTSGWEEHTYAVTAGVHTLKWAYEKDGSVSSGSDCGWIDDITFPGHTSAKNMRSITITAPTLPSWLTLTDNGDGTGVLSGTSPDEAGLHDVVIQAQDTGDPVTQAFTVNVGGVSVYNIKDGISIFPNPNNGRFFIDLQNLGEIADVKIQNLNGQVVYQTKANSKIIEADLSSHAKGVYFVRITSGKETYISKIILK